MKNFLHEKRVALITCSALPEGAESERLMLPHLRARGVDVAFVDWRDSLCDLTGFDLVVLRSCWDSHLHGAQFVEWLQRTASAVPLLNDVETVLWNRDKFYLRELAEKGIEIAPTIFVANGEEIGPAEWLQIQSWRKVVMKPAVSASAHNTWLADAAELPLQGDLSRKMQGEAFLVQQFIPEIQTQGEISFTLIDGAYCHAVRKRPAAGDFRVQEEHGGRSALFVPSSSLLDQVNAIAEGVPQIKKSLYCRIDVVERAGKLVLMELELIEPELYLTLADGAAERLAEAIATRIP
jgi:glutathione synthase/RimK-type ligase-like ATP-grasp enzyme